LFSGDEAMSNNTGSDQNGDAPQKKSLASSQTIIIVIGVFTLVGVIIGYLYYVYVIIPEQTIQHSYYVTTEDEEESDSDLLPEEVMTSSESGEQEEFAEVSSMEVGRSAEAKTVQQPQYRQSANTIQQSVTTCYRLQYCSVSSMQTAERCVQILQEHGVAGAFVQKFVTDDGSVLYRVRSACYATEQDALRERDSSADWVVPKLYLAGKPIVLLYKK
jgi:cell division septation protein DedD